MTVTAHILCSILAAGALIGAVACSDDDGETNDTPTGGAAGTQSAGGHDPGGGSPSEACMQGCAELWACTQQGDLCPGLPPEAEGSFMEGCGSSPICDTAAGFIDSDECPGSVDQMKSLSVDFKNVCEGMGDGGMHGQGGGGGSAS